MTSISARPQATPAAPVANPAPQAQVALKPTQEEELWTKALEKAVREGHEPTAQEIEVYNKLVQALGRAPMEPAQKGLLDYPKDLALAGVRASAAGQAKNSLEFVQDMKDIGRNLGDAFQHLKKGQVIGAASDGLRAVGNTVSGSINLVQSGIHSMFGGFSIIAAAPFSLLDRGAEAIGKHMQDSKSGVGQATAKAATVMGGSSTNASIFDAMQEGQRAGAAAAKIKRTDIEQ